MHHFRRRRKRVLKNENQSRKGIGYLANLQKMLMPCCPMLGIRISCAEASTSLSMYFGVYRCSLFGSRS